MRLGERGAIVASVLAAAAGIALLFLLANEPQKASVAQALLLPENSLVELSGTAANVTADRFLLCDSMCISVRKNGLPAGNLVANWREIKVRGTVQKYRGNSYIEAERIEVG